MQRYRSIIPFLHNLWSVGTSCWRKVEIYIKSQGAALIIIFTVAVSCSFDHLLDGGLYTAEITEVIGPVASGKTQVDTLKYYRESSCCSVVIRLRSITSYYNPSVCICMCVCMYVCIFVCIYVMLLLESLHLGYQTFRGSSTAPRPGCLGLINSSDSFIAWLSLCCLSLLQFCLSIALSVAMETKQNIVYFDTGSSFNIVRLQDMLEARQKDSTQVSSGCDRTVER